MATEQILDGLRQEYKAGQQAEQAIAGLRGRRVRQIEVAQVWWDAVVAAQAIEQSHGQINNSLADDEYWDVDLEKVLPHLQSLLRSLHKAIRGLERECGGSRRLMSIWHDMETERF